MNETLKRALSGAVYILLLVASIRFSTDSFFLLFGVFLLIAIYEFCLLIKTNVIFPTFLAATLYTLAYVSHLDRTYDQVLLFIALLSTVKCLFFLFEEESSEMSIYQKYFYIIGYIILPFIFITKIPFGIRGYNPKIIISIFILIWTNDTFAYIVGKSIGKHKLFEKISPKKTIEGFVGGVVFTVIASFVISEYYIEGARYVWINIAIIAAIFGTLGDLVESKFKRVAGVKDSGAIMPGHGGVLDRLDSIIFVAPIVFLLYQILYYVS
ncbi:phosphatidate cytidylyltransferase [Flavobacterium agrisoli]|uniref:Phosphatidate cytidylyltransferase n=1 Tax=Flavobacterium agrisoli TaxID=2793066 RepID=A0A934UJ07_9FLAO|nr:phosphatidate cytidylyltransferase [Flavobacterium agrisoli]MBK0368895.1 phosphatidate cytidylyltransferase [Flavobacterium agrisoli]